MELNIGVVITLGFMWLLWYIQYRGDKLSDEHFRHKLAAENKELRHENEELRHENEELRHENEELRHENEELRHENDYLRAELLRRRSGVPGADLPPPH